MNIRNAERINILSYLKLHLQYFITPICKKNLLYQTFPDIDQPVLTGQDTAVIYAAVIT